MDAQQDETTIVIAEPIDVESVQQVPGLRVRDADVAARGAATVGQFGDVPFRERVTVLREDIPAIVEALTDHARERDLDDLQARVGDAVRWGEGVDRRGARTGSAIDGRVRRHERRDRARGREVDNGQFVAPPLVA